LRKLTKYWKRWESGDDTKFAEELGDLLLQVVFHAQIATERRPLQRG